MEDGEQFTVATAREAAGRDDLRGWVAEFLASDGSDNAELGKQLSEPSRHWLGPVRLPIGRVHRLAGPPGEPVLCPVDEDWWRDDVEDLEHEIEEGWEPPPLVVTFVDGRLVAEDGNHRIEALRRAGRREAWAVVNFASTDERDTFTVPSDA